MNHVLSKYVFIILSFSVTLFSDEASKQTADASNSLVEANAASYSNVGGLNLQTSQIQGFDEKRANEIINQNMAPLGIEPLILPQFDDKDDNKPLKSNQ